MTGGSFIDVDFCQRPKTGQVVSGDVFLSRKIKEEDRIISVLSDGLGSGVKAGVLANLTATMALRYTSAFVDVRKSAGTIMDTLPVCQVRKISYSTFTIVDLDQDGRTRVIEHGNPPLILLRGAQSVPLERIEITLENWKDRTICYSEFDLQLGDRIVCLSDGISQSGLGRPGLPLGWGTENVVRFVSGELQRDSQVSSRELARKVLGEALVNDRAIARDDMTCGVVYYRHPRRLLVITGPPFCKERDQELADLILHFDGHKVISGGTTANIISRLLHRPVHTCLTRLDREIPPAAQMEGVDLITEGTMTLARVTEMLDRGAGEPWPDNPARDLLNLMLQSDIVEFVVGTRINEAHQDPNVPVELDLRRNIIRRMARLLERRYFKECRIQFI
ncbi:MAG TPA: SpoIIE family protein phosphatase [Clostridia bacterium]|nr:SpoIIE family protein phosphatase [Clostridia bacterium]